MIFSKSNCYSTWLVAAPSLGLAGTEGPVLLLSFSISVESIHSSLMHNKIVAQSVID